MVAGELEGEPGVDRAEDARRRAPARRRFEQPLDLRAEKYGSSTSPVRSRTSASWPASRSSSQRAAVRRSCQTSAWWSGSPCRGSHTTTVSRWLVMPIAVELAAVDAGVVERLARDRARHLPDLGRVVLDPAGPREVLVELAVGAAGELRLARRRRGTSCRSCPGRSRGSSAPRLPSAPTTRERSPASWPSAVGEAADAPSRGAVLEVELDSRTVNPARTASIVIAVSMP